jgi:allantoicase
MTAPFQDLVDLAGERLGASVVAANDDFFAPKENLIKAGSPVWVEGKYTDRGKWMDGWETRRLREPRGEPYDWCVIRLGAAGIVRGVDVETTHFKGNYPESCAIDAASPDHSPVGSGLSRIGFSRSAESLQWREILKQTPLEGDAHNLFAIDDAPPATHLRLRIFPDGGVARLRAYGEVVADWERLRRRSEVDLAAAEHGGLVVDCSDMFFGSRHNLIMPGDATHMGDGWETKRRRGPGHDWTIVRLAAAGTIHRVEVDTRHFKGNAPAACSLDARRPFESLRVAPSNVEGRQAQGKRASDDAWLELLPRTPLKPHATHAFDRLSDVGRVTHVRFNIYPDGGVSRLRLYGTPT